MRINKLNIIIGLIILFILINNLIFFPGNVFSWDVFGYYLYLPLKFIYHDLGLINHSVIENINNQYHNTSSFYQVIQTPEGASVMKYTMGLAIFYAPFFFAGHFVALIFDLPADGFSAPYQYSVFFGGIVYSIIGIVYLSKVLLHFFRQKVAIVVLLIIVFSTNYIVHITMYGQNGNSHNYLFTCYALILWFTIKWHESFKRKYAVFLAIICGLTILSRPSELVCLIIPFLWGVKEIKGFKTRINLFIKHKTNVILFGVIVFCIGALQLIYWKIYTGSFFYYSYGGNAGEGFGFLSPYIFEVLFSFRKGWLIYTPVMIFAFIGLYFLYKKNIAIFPAIFIYVIINLYVVSSWSCWWYAQSFSQRSLIVSYPVMAILLGYFISWLNERKPLFKTIMYFAFILFLGLNIFQTRQFYYGVIDGDRMTRAYYFATFGKMQATEKDKELLMVKRSFDGDDEFNDQHNYHSVLQKNIDFEDLTSADSSLSYSGKFSFRMDSAVIYSPSIELPYHELTKKDHAWIKISAFVFPPDNFKNEPFSLVAHFVHSGKPYSYKTIDSEKMILELNKWNKIEFDYLTPELRRKSDCLKVYFWNRGKAFLYVDDLIIEVFEKK